MAVGLERGCLWECQAHHTESPSRHLLQLNQPHLLAQLTNPALGTPPEHRQKLHSQNNISSCCLGLKSPQFSIWSPIRGQWPFCRHYSKCFQSSTTRCAWNAGSNLKVSFQQRRTETGRWALWLSKKRTHLLTGRCQCWRQAVPFHDSPWRLASMLIIMCCVEKCVYGLYVCVQANRRCWLHELWLLMFLPFTIH